MNIYPINFNNRKLKIHGRAGADESVMAEIFKYREYRAAEKIITEAKDVILDIGAHIGAFTLYCKILNPNLKILALEPEPQNFSLLQKNLKENRIKNVTGVLAALSDKTGTAKLLISQDSHNHRLWSDIEGPTEKQSIIVKTYSLAGLLRLYKISKIALLKLDIEGGEYQVFSALKPVNFNKIRNIIMEYHNHPGQNYKTIENQLRANGFSVEIFPSRFDNNLGFLLARNKR